VSTDYPILDVNWQPRSFGLLAFRCDVVTDYAAGLSIRGGNLTTRSPWLSVPGCLFIKCHHRQRPKPGAFAPLASSFLPCHQRQQWLPGGVVLARIRMALWVSIALDTPPILVLVFDSVSRGGSSFHIACIRCQISVNRQLSDRRPGVLPPTPYV